MRFLAHCRGVDPQFADLFELIIGTGMRKGEALTLHWDHIPLGDRIMSIRHTLSAVDDRLVLTTPKTKNSKAWVAMSDRVVAALEHRAQTKAPADARTRHGGYVFHGPDGQHLHPKDVLKCFHELRRQADLPHCTVHDLRRLTATLSLETGVPMPITSKTLRHSTLSTTANIYSHLTRTAAREAVEAVARLLRAAERGNLATATPCGRINPSRVNDRSRPQCDHHAKKAAPTFRRKRPLASSRGESHPPALSEPCLIVSDHTAPIVRSSTVTA